VPPMKPTGQRRVALQQPVQVVGQCVVDGRLDRSLEGKRAARAAAGQRLLGCAVVRVVLQRLRVPVAGRRACGGSARARRPRPASAGAAAAHPPGRDRAHELRELHQLHRCARASRPAGGRRAAPRPARRGRRAAGGAPAHITLRKPPSECPTRKAGPAWCSTSGAAKSAKLLHEVRPVARSPGSAGRGRSAPPPSP
jgi:hypothetical protein